MKAREIKKEEGVCSMFHLIAKLLEVLGSNRP